MRQVNLRLHGLLVSFSFALLSSVCLGYYAMSQSNFRALQAREIQAERERSQKLLREIEVFEALDQIETVLEVEASPPATVQWSCLPTVIRFHNVDSDTLEIDPMPAPSFEDLAEEQSLQLESQLGVFKHHFSSEFYKYR